MEKQIVYDRWVIIDTTEGMVAVPQDYIGKQTQFIASDVKDFIEGQFIEAHVVDGYGARMSMPGFLDCTEWTVFKTHEEADEFLCSMYLDDGTND